MPIAKKGILRESLAGGFLPWRTTINTLGSDAQPWRIIKGDRASCQSGSSRPLKAPSSPGLPDQHLWSTTAGGGGTNEGGTSRTPDRRWRREEPAIFASALASEDSRAAKGSVLTSYLRGLREAWHKKGCAVHVLEDARKSKEKNGGKRTLHIE